MSFLRPGIIGTKSATQIFNSLTRSGKIVLDAALAAEVQRVNPNVYNQLINKGVIQAAAQPGVARLSDVVNAIADKESTGKQFTKYISWKVGLPVVIIGAMIYDLATSSISDNPLTHIVGHYAGQTPVIGELLNKMGIGYVKFRDLVQSVGNKLIKAEIPKIPDPKVVKPEITLNYKSKYHMPFAETNIAKRINKNKDGLGERPIIYMKPESIRRMVELGMETKNWDEYINLMNRDKWDRYEQIHMENQKLEEEAMKQSQITTTNNQKISKTLGDIVIDKPEPQNATQTAGAGKKNKKVKQVKQVKHSKWQTHVKEYASKHNLTFFEALSKAKASYKK